MRILICDDDLLMTEQVKKYVLTYFGRIHLKTPEVACFSDGESLLSDMGKKDIVFLDIEMPGMNGIYTGNELKKQNKDIIIFIITSYIEYLDEAMKFHVFRYLSKPLEKQRFFRNLKDALKLYTESTKKIPIETKEGIYSVEAADIVSMEAFGRKVIVHTLARDFASIHTIQYWQEQLPENSFFQSHRSYIVNLKHITDFDHSLIHLCNNQFEAYLTRRKYTEFKDKYLLYLESTR